MKSMLHEASSVAKAVEKAWTESGKPREFTINVLELGTKNFFGFSKLPAIVSITFDPKSVPSTRPENDRRDSRQPGQRNGQGRDQRRNDPRDRRESGERQERGRTNDTRQPQRNQDARDQQKTQRPQQEPRQRELSRELPREQQPRQHTRPEQREPVQNQRVEREEFEELAAWTPELTADLQTDTAAMLAALAIATPYTITTDKRTAQLVFAEPLLATAEDERQLFMGMSYLLMQFLKKRHKKKLRGFHVTITANGRHATPDNQPTDS